MWPHQSPNSHTFLCKNRPVDQRKLTARVFFYGFLDASEDLVVISRVNSSHLWAAAVQEFLQITAEF